MNTSLYSPPGQEVSDADMALLAEQLRAAGAQEGHEFYGNQWTAAKVAEVAKEHETRVKAVVADDLYRRIEDVKAYGEAGKTLRTTVFERWGVTTYEEYQQKVDETLKKVMPEAKVFVRMNVGDLNAVLSSGEIQNAFQSGKSHGATTARGSIDYARRQYVEEKLHGVPESAQGSDRPKYGYLSSGNGISELPPGTLKGAGGVAVELNELVKDRTTFTIGDSLDHAVTLWPEGLGGGWSDNAKFIPQPVNKPSALAAPGGFIYPATTRAGARITSPTRVEQLSEDYVEAQIHGRVSVKNIKAITFDKKPAVATAARLKRLGIPYKVAKMPARRSYLRDAGAVEGHEFYGNQWTDARGVESLRQYSKKSLLEERAGYEALIKAYPDDRMTGGQKRLKEIDKELKFREDWHTRQTTHPDEIADISAIYQVRSEDLRGMNANIPGTEYFIGRGVGYSPVREADESSPFVMMEGKVVVGPRKDLGKDVSEVPEAMKALHDHYDKMVNAHSGGNFAEVGDDVNGSELGRVLWGYKSPLASSSYEPMLQSLTSAYLTGGKVAESEHKDPLAKRRESAAKLDREEPNWREDWPSIAADMTQQAEAKVMLDFTSGMDQIERDALSQPTVNQFANTVKETQKVLREKHPEGTVTLYRGVQGDYAKNIKKALKDSDEVEMQVRPATSWSESRGEAAKFAGRSGVTIRREVPVDDVLFSWETSGSLSARSYIFGGVEEQEVLVGSKSPTMKIKKGDLK